MAKKDITIETHKTIFQARYNPQLNFYPLLFSAAQELDNYKDWETNSLSITMMDFDNHCNVLISNNSFSYEQDLENDELEAKRINEVVQKLPSALKISNFTRFGYRKRFLIPIKNMDFNSLVTVIDTKLFSRDETFRDILPKVKDLTYRVDLFDNPFEYHLTIGPVAKSEIPNYVDFNIKRNLSLSNQAQQYQKIIDKYPDIAIFIDIDFFQQGESIGTNLIDEFVEIAKQRVHKLASNISHYLN